MSSWKIAGASLVIMLISCPALAQLKFPDGTEQSTAFGATNSTRTGSGAATAGGQFHTNSGNLAFIGGGSGNSATLDVAVVAGGINNQATGVASTIGGGATNTASGTGATVAGGDQNVASGNYSTVGGGQLNIANNTGATISGGFTNDATALDATVGGGSLNVAIAENATVAGGTDNEASGGEATVGGGIGNTASGDRSVVGGGEFNTASGIASTIPGGSQCVASGQSSFAMGFAARAIHQGALVFSDSPLFFFDSTAVNQFSVRATGGTRIVSGISGGGVPTTGVRLNAGGGAWSSLSDRNVKENGEAVDSAEVLEKIAALPIESWNYITQPDSVRHMGPMAQDFRAAFGLGMDDKTITTIDASGVALVGIQGLHEIVRDQNVQLARKDSEVAALREQNESLEARIAALESLVGELVD